MLKRLLNLKIVFAFFVISAFIPAAVFSQEGQIVHAENYSVSQPVRESMWYICKKSGNKAAKIKNGPFESRINAIAAWYYYSYSSKSACLAENMMFITADPENDFPEDYETVKKDLEENHAHALEKYSIKPNTKIERNYVKKTKNLASDPKIYEVDLSYVQKKLDFENKTTADFTCSVEMDFGKDIKIKAGDSLILKWKGKFNAFIPELYLNFLNETSVIATDIEEDELFEGYKIFEIKDTLPQKLHLVFFYSSSVNEPSRFTLVKRSDRIDLNKPPVETSSDEVPEVTEAESSETTEEEQEAEPDSNFEFIPKNISGDQSVSRYRKEYLQDYAVTDEFELPVVKEKQPEVIANPNQKDKDGKTDLMKACASGNEWQVKNLIDSGAKIDLQDNDGWTALMYAARYSGSLSTIELLLEAKADVKKTNKYNSTAFLIAVCYNNNPKLISRLMEYYSPTDKELLKAFVFLLSSTAPADYILKAKLELFINKQIPLNTFYNGKTPLMYAAQYSSSTDVIKILLDNDAVKTLRSVEGKTVFDYAKENSKLPHDQVYWSLNSK